MIEHLAVGKRVDRFSVYRDLKPDFIIFPELEIAKGYDGTTAIWSSKLKSTEKTKYWLEVLAGKNKISATRSGLFLPFRKLTTIIIDDPYHPGHREEQAPRYQSSVVARKLAEIHNAKLIIGLPVMGVAEYENFRKGQAKVLPTKRWRLPEIIIRQPSKESFANDTNRPDVVFLPSKGDYKGSICRDCGTLQTYPAPVKCLNCGSTKFKTYGIGVDEYYKRHGIKAVTQKIFDSNESFKTVLATGFDHLLILPDPMISQEIFQTLIKLAQMAQSTLIIETRHPEHRVIKYLTQPKLFLEHELSTLKQTNLPPYSRMVKLTSEKSKNKPNTPGAVVSDVHKNSKGQFQVIIRLKPATSLKQFKESIKSWRLDPDPQSLI